jgi:hypothetical protein
MRRADLITKVELVFLDVEREYGPRCAFTYSSRYAASFPEKCSRRLPGPPLRTLYNIVHVKKHYTRDPTIMPVTGQRKDGPLDFCILGAPKCGTTAMYTYLRTHPQIFMSQIKEPHFYADDMADAYRAVKNRQAYCEIFAGAADGQLCGEASVLYLFSERAVPNILRDSPDARFIVMLRNPVDMAQSLHSQLLRSLYEDEMSFRMAWELQDVRAAAERIPRRCDEPKLLLYRTICSFAWQMERLFQWVPRERVLVHIFEEFFSDPRAGYERTLAFLGLLADERTHFERVNENTVPRSWLLLGLAYYLRFVPNRLYAPLKQTFNVFGLRPGVAFFRWRNRPEKRAPIDTSFRHRLEAEFQPDIARLEVILERNLDVWRSN